MKYIIPLLFLVSVNLCSETLLLKNRDTQISIDPGTLEFKAKSAGGSWDTISTKQRESRVVIKESKLNSLIWEHSRSSSIFKVTLLNNQITIKIENRGKISVKWPIIQELNSYKALIWPYGDGLWIPYKSGESFFTREQNLPITDYNFWGVLTKNRTLTYIVDDKIETRLDRHRGKNRVIFNREKKVNTTTVTISDSISPIESGSVYRRHLLNSGELNLLNNELTKEQLLGSPIIELLGKDYITADDIKENSVIDLCKKIVEESKSVETPSFNIKRSLLGKKEWLYISNGAKESSTSRELKQNIAKSLSMVISAPNFYSTSSNDNSTFLYNSFKEFLEPVDSWGSGETMGVLTKLKRHGIDRSIIFTQNRISTEMKDYAKELNYTPGERKLFKDINLKETRSFEDSHKIPLINAVYHDSYIMSRIKRPDKNKLEKLKFGLYMQAPVYHMDNSYTSKQKEIIKEYANIFNDVHSKYGASQMTGFDFLSSSKMIQRTKFSGGLSVVANFTQIECGYKEYTIPPESLLITTPEGSFIY